METAIEKHLFGAVDLFAQNLVFPVQVTSFKCLVGAQRQGNNQQYNIDSHV